MTDTRAAVHAATLAYLERISAIGIAGGIVSIVVDDSPETFNATAYCAGESEPLRIALTAALDKVRRETDGDQIVDKAIAGMDEGIPVGAGEVEFPAGRSREDLERAAEAADAGDRRFDRMFGGDEDEG